jgi:ABC-type transport system substrate-binding protein
MDIGNEPSSLHPINQPFDGAAVSVREKVLEPLATRSIDTYEWEPALATEWTIAEDKLSFTFKLRKGVKWHDGKEFTAHDVKFSFDCFFDEKFNGAAMRPLIDGIKEVQVIDDYTVKFIAKDKYYKNFDTAAGLDILPKHFYYQEGKTKGFFNKTLVGTGAYKLEIYKRGNRVVLVKNKDWWGFKDPENKEHNFDKIVQRFVSNMNVNLEMLKKGSLDFAGMTPDMYVKRTTGPEWGTKVQKVKARNKSPKGYNFIGWNLKHPILKDRMVRKALYHLVNRKLMVEKFEYGMSEPAIGPIYHSSPYHDKSLKPIQYNPKLALKILRERGWSDTDGDNILDKVIDGKKTKFTITLLEPSENFLKYDTVFKEDASKVGVELNIKQIEWNSFVKLLDERKFDAVRLAWSASVDWDPKQIWHSDSINGGSNFISYSNPKLDKIIDEVRYIHNRDERIKRLKEAEKIIVNDHPYVWFTYKDITLYGHTNRIKKEKDSHNYSIGTTYWDFKSKMRKEVY